MGIEEYSTGQVAKKVGVDKMTLLGWMKHGLIPKARRIKQLGGGAAWAWTDAHIAAAKKIKGTLRRGPKPKRRGDEAPR